MKFSFKLPFVSRRKYERVKADAATYRQACEFKQVNLLHWRDRFYRLHHETTWPREKGRFAKRSGIRFVGTVAPDFLDKLERARNKAQKLEV